jgi:hypothetical protein
MLFYGSRTGQELAATDGEVEFKVRVRRIEIKRKFGLAAMQYKGQLSL